MNIQRLQAVLDRIDPIQIKGRVRQVIGLVIESEGPHASLGEICFISSGNRTIRAEVVGFLDKNLLLMPIGEMEGIRVNDEVVATGKPLMVSVSESLKGRILNGVGEPQDGKGPIVVDALYPILREPPNPLQRPRINEIFSTGIRAIDSCLTVGKGQRFGIFSGSGIGKSTLLGMLARFVKSDINVIALIGERGREVNEFIEKDLQEEGLSRSVIVVATSDQPPLLRLRGAFVATAIAEYFRDLGMDVLLMMDSITRFARAQREVGLSIGEPPATRGFTPSVFAILPRLLERAGTSEKGTITGIYTILVDADDMNEPISDNVRAILDGHVVLSRELAEKNHYPAIDILQSVSRVMIDIVDEEQERASRHIKEILAVIRDAQDLINIGAYVKGSNTKIDYALTKIDEVNNFLIQGIWEKSEYRTTVDSMMKIVRNKE
ncbi:TPA: flagellar protein export ATPase FliI [bacterium]|nr:flagellar protein export ATPase FliI [bacterium]